MARAADNGGFTLVGLLVIMTIIGIMTMVVSKTWKVASRAEKEEELIWTGKQFRQAIRRYYEGKEISHPPSYPADLKDLLKDPRSMGLHRYLRKIYIDPMTGKDDWVVVMDGNMHIKGVHSNSDAAPLKRDNFDLDDTDFRGKERYSEWVFQYPPVGAAVTATTPGTTGTAGH